MLFSSPEYIFVFLPAVFVCYFGICRNMSLRGRNIFLLVASLFFYSYWLPIFLPLLLVSVTVNYFFGKFLRKSADRLLLTAGIVLNCIPLCFFKYTVFLLSNINFLADVTGIDLQLPDNQLVLPLGISFYTFQQIAYLVDCYRGGVEKYKFADYALFISFWPQLIAGPIVHHSQLLPQLRKERNRRIYGRNIYAGMIFFIAGLAKKILIADRLGAAADWGWGVEAGELGTASAWLTTVTYSLQLYFDFSGYCDMACGSALLFNIRLPMNFNSPYKAVSVQDFWHRWHMTLSAWLRDYLYIPFGGSRKGLARTVLNIFLTFLIGGLWHGAGWTFVIWGGMHGFALAINNLWKKLVNVHIPVLLCRIMTLLFVHFAWVIFRAPDMKKALGMYRMMFGGGSGTVDFQWRFTESMPFYFYLSVAAVMLFMPNTFEISRFLSRKIFSKRLQIITGGICALLLFLCILRFLAKDIPQSPFLYFQF